MDTFFFILLRILGNCILRNCNLTKYFKKCLVLRSEILSSYTYTDQSWVSWTAGRFFTIWATREAIDIHNRYCVYDITKQILLKSRNFKITALRFFFELISRFHLEKPLCHFHFIFYLPIPLFAGFIGQKWYGPNRSRRY